MRGDAEPGRDRSEPTGHGVGPGRSWRRDDDHLLVDSLNDAVVVADEDGRILYANPATHSLLGWDPEELRGSSLLRLVPERLRHLHEAGFDAFMSSGLLKRGGQPIRVPARRADGSEVPIELLLSALERPAAGRAVVGTLRDARERFDIERHRQVADQLLGILARGGSMSEAAPRVLEAIGEALGWDMATLWIPEATSPLRCRYVWHADGAGLDRFARTSLDVALGAGEGLPGAALASGEPAWVVDLGAVADLPRRREAMDDGLRSALVVPIFADAEAVGVVELFSRRARQRDEALLEAMATIGERLGPFLVRIRAEEEREVLLAELEAARRAQQFVLHASRVLSEAKDYRQALERLASLAVPTLGDLCLIDVVDRHGGLRRMAARHADPRRQTAVERLERDYPPDALGAHPVVEVIRSGRSAFSPEMPPDFLRRTTRDDEHLELVTELEFSSYMSVPLVAGTRVLGAVTLVSAGSGRRFSERDLALVEDLAGQVAAVVENARELDMEHRIARTLQRSLLPDRLVAPDGLEVAARYLPMTEGAEIGGDWYDVFPTGDGKVVTVVGDVEGHDMVAAAVMGQLRSVLRAYALEVDGPGGVLGRLSRFALASQLPRMATVLVATLDPGTGGLSMASAGHHPPMLVSPRTGASLLSLRPGPPVGVEPHDHDEASGRLGRGDALLLYTDGLVESRSMTVAVGLEEVAAVAARQHDGLEELCAALEEEVAGRRDRNDDVAFLVVRRREPPAPPGG